MILKHLFIKKIIMIELNIILAVDKKYYIATYKFIKLENIILLVNRISRETFFRFSVEKISKYFYWYSGMFITQKPPVEILQLHILDDGTYTAVLKTFWLKLIQRHWKKVYKVRQEILQCRKKISTLRNFEISGKYPVGFRVNIGLRGMMSDYLCKDSKYKN